MALMVEMWVWLTRSWNIFICASFKKEQDIVGRNVRNHYDENKRERERDREKEGGNETVTVSVFLRKSSYK